MQLTRRDTFALAGALAAPAPSTRATPGISLNEDNSHFFFTRGDHRLTAAELDAFVDQYANTHVRELLFSPNCMRTNYTTKVGTPIWYGYQPDGPDDQPLLHAVAPASRKFVRKWIHSAWQADREGLDVYTRWLNRARQKGMGAWLSMRMNDIHEVDKLDSPLHSEFWRQHPEFRRTSYRFAGWADRAFDYAHPEVYNYHFAMFRELVERYDFDGIELDWMRFGFHFRPGHEREGCAILTRFMSEARALLRDFEKRRGHRIELGVRVPSRPQSAEGLGMDAVTWAERGLVDRIVVTPFWATIDTDMPIELWKRLLKGTGVLLGAGLELLLRPYPAWKPRPYNTLETARAAALSYIDRGADRVYLFNYMDADTTIVRREDYPVLLTQLGDARAMLGKPRRHIVTYPDTSAPGQPDEALLPAACRPGRWNAFRIHTGPVEAGRAVEARFAMEGATADELKPTEVRVNGALCAWRGVANAAPPAPEQPLLAWSVPAGVIQRGYNLLEFSAAKEGRVVWAEFAVI
jgi:hypothetical protein